MKWSSFAGNSSNDGLDKPFVFLLNTPERFLNIKQSCPLNKKTATCKLRLHVAVYSSTSGSEQQAFRLQFLFFHISKELIIHKTRGNPTQDRTNPPDIVMSKLP
ncbi:MAG: hypothetical protein BROFUL_00120 [Candidatus Brocadia fulgida]|uniref:Uncharacterized protein n=1 Tax=Candidatus Brocadia fulgida TaxID=380242 RepID=A0A0M2V3B7_9BACT|nr:MAG: hypothetical protein BROFUL_00120 [Candidatus Brocadia fulgida]